jgi:tRNA-splicing ligase RtcB
MARNAGEELWVVRKGATRPFQVSADESPMAYRRLPDVLAVHANTIVARHTLKPFPVVMAGADESDPFKD